MPVRQETTKFSPKFSLEEGLLFLVHKDGQDFSLEGDKTLVIRRSEKPADYSALPLSPVIERFYPRQYRLVTLCKDFWEVKEELGYTIEDFSEIDPNSDRFYRWKRRQKRLENQLQELKGLIENLEL